MKNKDAVSAVIGSAFFAVPYLALSVPVLPSLLIGAAAFGAGELLFTKGKLVPLKDSNRPLYEKLEYAKNVSTHIESMITKIDNEELKKNLKEITDTINKIIGAINNRPKKADKINNFFDYYLPVTVSIVDRYDEIENQKLSSKDGKKFMEDANKMIIEVNKAFKKILDNLYQKEIVDADAEMKVFNSMLKADGYKESINDKVVEEEK